MPRTKAIMVAQIKNQMKQAGEKKARRKLKKSRDRNAEKQIQLNQTSGRFKIPREPVKRLVREIADSFNSDILISSQAFELLQAASEDCATELLKDANEISVKVGKRATVLPQDIRAAARIRQGVEKRYYSN